MTAPNDHPPRIAHGSGGLFLSEPPSPSTGLPSDDDELGSLSHVLGMGLDDLGVEHSYPLDPHPSPKRKRSAMLYSDTQIHPHGPVNSAIFLYSQLNQQLDSHLESLEASQIIPSAHASPSHSSLPLPPAAAAAAASSSSSSFDPSFDPSLDPSSCGTVLDMSPSLSPSPPAGPLPSSSSSYVPSTADLASFVPHVDLSLPPLPPPPVAVVAPPPPPPAAPVVVPLPAQVPADKPSIYTYINSVIDTQVRPAKRPCTFSDVLESAMSDALLAASSARLAAAASSSSLSHLSSPSKDGYPVEILGTRTIDGCPFVRIHYIDYSSSYDEWVPSDLIRS